eukprot:CAMPEP_0170270536 /NCGR_PEP_ID=MMETSP0116_2-20130129/35213_1 /TAXON_ID=400756 /ORGANISM="Durinskia baltica, Strain CSIRO CS-38" /LENGTH=133 /DNA_ID=CAMNT_0010521729 /DNA_START=83 /DNA_END=481 /DNA_ORIENTATION=+
MSDATAGFAEQQKRRPRACIAAISSRNLATSSSRRRTSSRSSMSCWRSRSRWASSRRILSMLSRTWSIAACITPFKSSRASPSAISAASRPAPGCRPPDGSLDWRRISLLDEAMRGRKRPEGGVSGDSRARAG